MPTPYEKFMAALPADAVEVKAEELQPGDMACAFNFVDGRTETQGAMFGVIGKASATEVLFALVTSGIKGNDVVEPTTPMCALLPVNKNDRFYRLPRA